MRIALAEIPRGPDENPIGPDEDGSMYSRTEDGSTLSSLATKRTRV